MRCLLQGRNRFTDLRCARLLCILKESGQRAQLLWVESRHGRWLLRERGRCRWRLRERCRRLKGERWRLCWRLPLRSGADRRRGSRSWCRGYSELSYLSSDGLQCLGSNLLGVQDLLEVKQCLQLLLDLRTTGIGCKVTLCLGDHTDQVTFDRLGVGARLLMRRLRVLISTLLHRS